jgi:C1A family cysteine protease
MGITKVKHTFGWRPSKPDHRDHRFASTVNPSALPSFADLRTSFPTVFNQGDLGSCTANAIAGAIEFDQIKQRIPIWIPSRLFIYYNERLMEGTVNSDAGAEIRDGVKSVNKYGVPPEADWPYDIKKFAVKPSAKAYSDALKTKAVSYQAINQDVNSMKSCIAGGYGFVFGFTVYESFESDAVANTGIMPMPGTIESQIGGHAVVAVGYNDGPNTVNGVPPRFMIVRNSWGPNWGVNGYFFMPYEYITNEDLADDFWKITVIT